MPSGMMTMSEVPTRTPMPIVLMRRICACERVTAMGSIPAAKELESDALRSVRCSGGEREGGEIRGSYAMAMTMPKSRTVKRPSAIAAVGTAVKKM